METCEILLIILGTTILILSILLFKSKNKFINFENALSEDKQEYAKTFLKLKKEVKKLEELKSELYPLHQENVIANLEKPIKLLGGEIHSNKVFISVQDGKGIIHTFEDSEDSRKMKQKFRGLLHASNPMNETGFKKSGTVIIT